MESGVVDTASDTIMAKHRNVVVLCVTGALVVLFAAWLGRAQPAQAHGAAQCDVGVAGAGLFAPGEMSRRLERAWNSSDTETTALFAEGIRIGTPWGQVWAKDELPEFLQSFFHPGDSLEARPLLTLAECETGQTVIWTFRYPSGVNSAVIGTLDNDQVVKLYWLFLPYDFEPTHSDSPEPVAGRNSGPSAAVEASAIALAGGGLMCLVIRMDGPKRPIRVTSGVVSALRVSRRAGQTQQVWAASTGSKGVGGTSDIR